MLCKDRDTQTQRGDDLVKIQTDRQPPVEVRKRQRQSLPKASEEVVLLTSSLQNCGRINVYFFEPPSKESYHEKKFGLSSS